jgi:hypothetical protein
MQVFPNFTSSTVRGGSAAPIQAVAQTYSITSNDVNNGYASVPVTWDTPFADSNYVVVFTVEFNGLASPPGTQFSGGFIAQGKTASGFTAKVNGDASWAGLSGQQITIHAVAFHL